MARGIRQVRNISDSENVITITEFDMLIAVLLDRSRWGGQGHEQNHKPEPRSHTREDAQSHTLQFQCKILEVGSEMSVFLEAPFLHLLLSVT